MVIQSVAILDQLDKDINLFGMRIREWYAYHYPELFTLVPDLYNYVCCASTILNRINMDDEVISKLHGKDGRFFMLLVMCFKILEIFPENEQKVNEIVEAARTSMGMEISAMDLENIKLFANRVASLSEFRKNLHDYLKNRMESCAPSLNALIGEQVIFYFFVFKYSVLDFCL